MIINSHVHLDTKNSEYFFYPEFRLQALLQDMHDSRIDISILCQNPKISEFRCPNDCSLNCPVHGGKINHVDSCPFDCKSQAIHTVVVCDSIDGELILKCTTCNTIVYKGADPLRQYNIELIEQINSNKKLLPILYLHLANSTINHEIEFFETHYAGQFIGYKLHPQTDNRPVSEIHSICTALPIMIHTGLRQVDHPTHVVEFSKHHSGNIILAHACRLDIQSLQFIANAKNLYVDVCPAATMYRFKEHFLDKRLGEKVLSPADIYKEALNIVGIDKVLFGTDVPWGNSQEEVDIVNSLHISTTDKRKIFSQNASAVYAI